MNPKRILATAGFFLLIMVVVAIVATEEAEAMTGSGTVGDPYMIYDVDDLQDMNLNLSANYSLANDINATATVGWNAGAGFLPVGTLANKFTGNFDGNNYTIDGLFIDRPATDYVGLFGYVDTGAVVENVALVDNNIAGHQFVGGLVGSNNWGSVNNSYTTGNTTGDYYVGGLIGYNYYGSVSNSYVTGNTTGIEGVGGLVGYNWGSLSDCYATGNATGTNDVGGLIGWNKFGSVSNSYATGNTTGTFRVGGLVGMNEGSVDDSYATGNTTGTSIVGGLVGYNFYGSVNNSYATGNTTGNYYVGGLVGYNIGSVSNCYATGNTTGTDWYVGGLVGYNFYGSVSNCYATGNTTGISQVGGLVGSNNWGSVNNSYATGNATGTSYVGGLIGFNDWGSVTDCYATGTVTRKSGSSDTRLGGFVGTNYQGKIINCYSTGRVIYEGATDPTDKGFVGSVDTGGSYEMSGNYWDTETSLQTTTAGNATGKTTAQMYQEATFVGWDFTNIWWIDEGNDYPRLQWKMFARTSINTIEEISGNQTFDGFYSDNSTVYFNSTTGTDTYVNFTGIVDFTDNNIYFNESVNVFFDCPYIIFDNTTFFLDPNASFTLNSKTFFGVDTTFSGYKTFIINTPATLTDCTFSAPTGQPSTLQLNGISTLTRVSVDNTYVVATANVTLIDVSLDTGFIARGSYTHFSFSNNAVSITNSSFLGSVGLLRAENSVVTITDSTFSDFYSTGIVLWNSTATFTRTVISGDSQVAMSTRNSTITLSNSEINNGRFLHSNSNITSVDTNFISVNMELSFSSIRMYNSTFNSVSYVLEDSNVSSYNTQLSRDDFVTYAVCSARQYWLLNVLTTSGYTVFVGDVPYVATTGRVSAWYNQWEYDGAYLYDQTAVNVTISDGTRSVRNVTVYVDQETELDMRDFRILPIQPIILERGWNLVGISHSTLLTADNLMKEIGQGATIYKRNADGTYQMRRYHPTRSRGIPDFVLEPNTAYYIYSPQRTPLSIDISNTTANRTYVEYSRGWNMVSTPGDVYISYNAFFAQNTEVARLFYRDRDGVYHYFTRESTNTAMGDFMSHTWGYYVYCDEDLVWDWNRGRTAI